MVQFHTKMVDNMEELLHETAEVSILGSVPLPLLSCPLLSGFSTILSPSIASTLVSLRRCSPRAVRKWAWRGTSWPSRPSALTSASVVTPSVQKRSAFDCLMASFAGSGSEKVCNTCMFVQMEAMEKKSLNLCVTFLEQIAKMTSTVVLELCAEQCNLNDKVRKNWVPVVKIKLNSSRVEFSPLFPVSLYHACVSWIYS